MSTPIAEGAGHRARGEPVPENDCPGAAGTGTGADREGELLENRTTEEYTAPRPDSRAKLVADKYISRDGGAPDIWADAAAEYRAELRLAPTKRFSLDGDVDRLARLPALAYDRVRQIHADEIGCRVTTLDKAVEDRRREIAKERYADDDSDPFAPLDPWHDRVAGDAIMGELVGALDRHMILPAGANVAIALWVLHAHSIDTANISPLLGITSPTPECGKTTLLTFLGGVSPKPLPASNITPAVLFRAVEKWAPTLLVDEADTFLRDNLELRGIINCGHNRAGAFVLRTVGDDHEPRKFRTWSPKAVALIGKLPATLESRAIHIELRRKAPGETVEPLRLDKTDHLHVMARKATRWAADNEHRLRAAEPSIPSSLTGRRADNWRHLLAIADLCGGDWPERARRAAASLVGAEDGATSAVLLLADIRSIFEERAVDRIGSEEVVAALEQMLDRPWPEFRNGKPITQRQVAKLLGDFKVSPRNIKDFGSVRRGYRLDQFKDAFDRYLPSRSATPLQCSEINGLAEKRSATHSPPVADRNPSKSLKTNNSSGVADREPLTGEEVENRCEHCGGSGSVQECFVDGREVRLHRECEATWRASIESDDDFDLPPFARSIQGGGR